MKYGWRNWLVIGDAFTPEEKPEEKLTDEEFMDKYSGAGEKREPPCTSLRFAEQMKQRAARAAEKNVDLFTSGKDQPFVLDKYKDAFEELILTEKFSFNGLKWGNAAAVTLVEVLHFCLHIKEPWLDVCCLFQSCSQA